MSPPILRCHRPPPTPEGQIRRDAVLDTGDTAPPPSPGLEFHLFIPDRCAVNYSAATRAAALPAGTPGSQPAPCPPASPTGRGPHLCPPPQSHVPDPSPHVALPGTQPKPPGAAQPTQDGHSPLWHGSCRQGPAGSVTRLSTSWHWQHCPPGWGDHKAPIRTPSHTPTQLLRATSQHNHPGCS